MTDRPKIPHDPPHNLDWVADDKRWTRKLSEAGKLTSPGKRIPFYGPPRYARVNAGEKRQ